MPCNQARALLTPPERAPIVVLTPANSSTVFMEFGKAPPFNLLPCRSATDTDCGAVAYDVTLTFDASEGAVGALSNSTTDMSGSVQMVAISQCAAGTACLACAPEQAMVPGSCAPGVYTLRCGDPAHAASSRGGS